MPDAAATSELKELYADSLSEVSQLTGKALSTLEKAREAKVFPKTKRGWPVLAIVRAMEARRKARAEESHDITDQRERAKLKLLKATAARAQHRARVEMKRVVLRKDAEAAVAHLKRHFVAVLQQATADLPPKFRLDETGAKELRAWCDDRRRELFGKKAS